MAIIPLRIYVIDRENGSADPSFELTFSPDTLFSQLKFQVFKELNFPEEIQIWIYKDVVCGDDETLGEKGLIEETENVLFLYLLSEDEGRLKREGSLSISIKNIFGTERPVYFPDDDVPGWACIQCTYRNLPTRPGCEICSCNRPVDYKVPDDYELSEEEVAWRLKEQDAQKKREELDFQRLKDREENFAKFVRAEDELYMPNPEPFECCICFGDIVAGDGIILRECAHNICKDCLMSYIAQLDNPQAPCPEDGCEAFLQDREIRGVARPEDFEKYTRLCHRVAEAVTANSFHCKTPDCQAWVVYEDEVNFFRCPICQKNNCLTCNAIHEGMTCLQYQDDLKVKAENDDAAKKDMEALELMITRGEAMKCPGCQIFVMKKSGCDWMQCSMCKTEICWATKGPRWGPKGNGDRTGGCGCNPPQQKCAPNCGNCH